MTTRAGSGTKILSRISVKALQMTLTDMVNTFSFRSLIVHRQKVKQARTQATIRI